ncbi:MAG TPA: hypothetical protein H9870_05240 [Candidatus Corynebacterium avicola]|uniref:Uncharacterized protein n=1 Tax=Candidatus Corynebacterium avicola TaxID=2838527 RepID=A0A9D1ULL0_9CORY|nr:hypothetical protein [Candidatus Corynebacterium avicola]
MTRTSRVLLAVWCVVVTCVVFWPFAATLVRATVGIFSGSSGDALLLRDMSVPPTMALNDLATGQDGLPRAMPQDAVLAVLSPLIPPPVVVSIIMLACGVLGTCGAAILAHRFSSPTCSFVPFLAAGLTLWNPFVAERLLQGHWSVVAAGVLLPTIALVVGRGSGRSVLLVIPLLLVCALTPTGLILATVTALVACLMRPRGQRGVRAAALAVTAVVLSLPWAVTTLLNAGATATLSDAAGADMFAARAEPWVGTLGALAGLGGVWNAEAVPASREWLAPVSTLAGVLLALTAVVVAVLLARRGRLQGTPLVVLALVAVVVPAVMATSPGLAITGWAIENVPGAGLVRDAQKFVVLALPGLIVLLAQVPVLVGRLTDRTWVPQVSVLSLLVLVWAGVPALPRDVSEVTPVAMDDRYSTVVDQVDQWAEAPGNDDHPRTLLWPPGNYRMVADRPVLDPLLKMLPGSPVDPGYLIVDGELVDGDADTVRLLGDLASGEDSLAENDIDLVVVQDGGPEAATDTALEVLDRHELLWADDGWSIYTVQ